MHGKYENGLTHEAAAETLYRAWGYAKDLDPIPDFNGLNTEIMDAWGRLALRAEAVMLPLEGKPLTKVASEVATFWSRGVIDYDKLALIDQLAWQAVSRHLATLIDAEEIPDLKALERSWGPWVATKFAKAQDVEHVQNAGS